MDRENRLLTLALIIFLLGGATFVFSQTPPGPNTIQEGEGLNLPTVTATNGYFYGAENVTNRFFGDFGAYPITTTGALVTSLINTGPGFTEVYQMDQPVRIADDVNFSSVEADDYWLDGSTNLTAWVETQVAAAGGGVPYDQSLNTTDDVMFQGVETGWIDLDGVNRTTWPSGGGVPYDQSLNTTDNVNFTSVEADDYWLDGSTNLTAWVESQIDGVPKHNQDLNTTDDVVFNSVDTGQGANELYDMDQNVLTTSDVNFSSVEADDYYLRGSTNLTAWVESEIDTVPKHNQDLNTTDDVEFHGVTTGWIDLGGENRTSWPGAVPGSGNSTYIGDTFLVVYDGANYLGIYYNGTILFTDASPYTTIQNCIDYVTANAAGNPNYLNNRVLARGSVRLGPGTYALGNNYLKLPNHFTFSGAGPGSTIITTTHTTTVLAPMWSNYTYDVTIQDLSIWGASGTTDYPLKWYMTESTLPGGETYSWWLKINDVAIRNYQNGPALFQTTTGSSQTILQITDFRVTGKIYFNRISEAMMDNFFCYGLDLDSVATSHFSNGYVGGSNDPNIYLYGDSESYPNDGNIFTNIRSDNPSGECFYVSGYSQKNQIIACQFSNSNNNGNDAALRFGSNTKENLVTSCSFVNYPRQSPDLFKYLVWFEAGSVNNTLLCNYYQWDAFNTASVLDQGSNLVETLPTPP